MIKTLNTTKFLKFSLYIIGVVLIILLTIDTSSALTIPLTNGVPLPSGFGTGGAQSDGCNCSGWDQTTVESCAPNPAEIPAADTIQCQYCSGTCEILNECCCAAGYELINGQCEEIEPSAPFSNNACEAVVVSCEADSSNNCCYQPYYCDCELQYGTGWVWDQDLCSCREGASNMKVQMKSENQCYINSQTSITFKRDAVVCENGLCENIIENSSGEYRLYSKITEGSCPDFSPSPPNVSDPISADNQYNSQKNFTNVSNVALTKNTGISPNTNYCISTVARYYDSKRFNTYVFSPTQYVQCPTFAANTPPATPVLNITTNNDYIGGLQEDANLPVSDHSIRVFARDSDSVDDISEIIVTHWPRQVVNQGSREDFMFKLIYDNSTSEFLITTETEDNTPLAPNGTDVTYSEDPFTIINPVVSLSGVDPANMLVLDYTLKFNEPYYRYQDTNSKDTIGVRTIDDDNNISDSFTYLYVDTDAPYATVYSPNASRYYKGDTGNESDAIDLQFSYIFDLQPSHLLAHDDGITLAYSLPTNCVTDNCDIENGAKYIIPTAHYGDNPVTYYLLDTNGKIPDDSDPVFEIPQSQIITTLNSSRLDPSYGSYLWESSLNQDNMRLLVATFDELGNLGVDISDETFGIDSEIPSVSDINFSEYTKATKSNNGYIDIKWPESTDSVSGVETYYVAKYHINVDGMVPYFDLDELLGNELIFFGYNTSDNLPSELTFNGADYTFTDETGVDTVKPDMVSLENDGSPSHDPGVWTENSNIIIEWRYNEGTHDRYYYQIITKDEVGWSNHTNVHLISIDNPVENYRVEYEFISLKDDPSPGIGTIEYTQQVDHVGPQNSSILQTTSLDALSDGHWYIYITAQDSKGVDSITNVIGPISIGGTKPILNFFSISGETSTGYTEYLFGMEEDPAIPESFISTAHATFDLYDISVIAESQDFQNPVNDVRIVALNGESLPGGDLVMEKDTGATTPLGGKFTYLISDGVPTLALDTFLRFNRVTIEASDGISTQTATGIIEYLPEAHLDVKVTADVSASFTPQQIAYDDNLLEDWEIVDFTTTVSSAGAKGLSASYYSDNNWTTLNSNRIDHSFNNGSISPPLSSRSSMVNFSGVDIQDPYSVKWEGRIKVPQSGRYYFDVELGNDDAVEVKFDMNDPYVFENLGNNAAVKYNTTLYGDGTGDPLFLEQGIWYGISIKYIGRNRLDFSAPDDVIRILWKYEPDGAITDCTPVDANSDDDSFSCTIGTDNFTDPEPIGMQNLSFNAGNITRIIDDFAVSVTMPEGYEYLDLEGYPRISYENSIGQSYDVYSTPPIVLRPLVSPVVIQETDPIQTLIWEFDSPTMESHNDPDRGSETEGSPIRFKTTIPVGKSLQITHKAYAKYARLIEQKE